jgi:hypothetical protein
MRAFAIQRVDGMGNTLHFSTEPPPISAISEELWQQALCGECDPGVLAGEGLLVIQASNGTVRYRLGEYDHVNRSHSLTRFSWEPSR